MSNNMTNPGPEFRWVRNPKQDTVTYRNPSPTRHGDGLPFYMYGKRKAPKTQSGAGKVCPGCGLTRSRMNRCECNS